MVFAFYVFEQIGQFTAHFAYNLNIQEKSVNYFSFFKHYSKVGICFRVRRWWQATISSTCL